MNFNEFSNFFTKFTVSLNFDDFQPKTPGNSEELRGTPRNSEELREGSLSMHAGQTPRNSEEFRGDM